MRIRSALLATCMAAALLGSGCSGATPTAPDGASRAAVTPPPAEAPVSSLSTPAASAPASAPVKPAIKPQAATTEATTTSQDGKFFGYLKKATLNGGDVVITVDYAQMLSGKAAADAAKAHGEAAALDNDYYIVNDNPKLRTFVMAKDAKVSYLIGGEPMLHPVSANGFLGKWENAPGDATILHQPYWLTMKGGRIVKLEQQYLP